MSRIELSAPGKRAGNKRKPRSVPDKRARRTQNRLGTALLELLLDKPIHRVTVQEVLDRAKVGRSTFYLHFRGKDDLLLSQLEMFLETMSTLLSSRGEQSLRVAPVAEMFAHIASARRFYQALTDCGRLQDFYDLGQGYFARGIERRLKESHRLEAMRPPEIAARACALAGSLLALLRWWMDRGAKETPEELDALFHRMAWKGIR